MGGQACVLYGAAEFSRDLDLAILASPANLSRLHQALNDLDAEVIAVPPFEAKYLRKGHAVHFRCRAPEVNGLRVDVMTKMRGVDSFSKLWQRRVTLQAHGGTLYELISLPDLVKAKKTQRDKDWPMIRRLVEADYFSQRLQPSRHRIEFWLLELRTPPLLIDLASANRAICGKLMKRRSLLNFAIARDQPGLEEALKEEEQAERESDRQYWKPLRAELERLRHARLTTL
jgi:hypothetical protein